MDAPESYVPNGNMRFSALTLPGEKIHCGCDKESEATTAIIVSRASLEGAFAHYQLG